MGPYPVVIHTVLGPIAANSLGRCLMHEHLICNIFRVTGNVNHLLNDEAMAVQELQNLRSTGGASLVECTTPDLGRAPDRLVRIAQASGVHVIMGTGWYTQPYYPSTIDTSSTESLAEILVTELSLGLGDSGYGPGIIGEIGTAREYATAGEERVFRAAARAQKATGAPITTHASMFPVGIVQLSILDEEGVDLRRVIVGHADTCLDEAYHLAVIARGATLGFDTIGRTHINPDSQRVEAILRLLALGHVGSIVLSSDRCHRSDLTAFGGAGYGFVFGAFFDQLRRAGVSQSELDIMTVENPRRLLDW